MKRPRGFRVSKPLIKLCRWLTVKRRSSYSYRRLKSPAVKSTAAKTHITKFCFWDSIKTRAKNICSIKPAGLNLNYTPLKTNDPVQEKPVPKGHLAVYVGQKAGDGELSRVVVPVFYFNHPLFGELLREAEKEFGYHHPGRITIPCRISEFERVQTTIAAGNSGRSFSNWKKHL